LSKLYFDTALLYGAIKLLINRSNMCLYGKLSDGLPAPCLFTGSERSGQADPLKYVLCCLDMPALWCNRFVWST